MSRFGRNIAPFVDAELSRAHEAGSAGRAHLAFFHLERAHVLGQASTYLHLRVHLQMLRWGWQQRSLGEVRGQLLRLVGALSMTAVGLVPEGNTGGADASPFRPMPVPPELGAMIRRARS